MTELKVTPHTPTEIACVVAGLYMSASVLDGAMAARAHAVAEALCWAAGLDDYVAGLSGEPNGFSKVAPMFGKIGGSAADQVAEAIAAAVKRQAEKN